MYTTHNLKYHISDHHFRILIIGGSGTGKTNVWHWTEDITGKFALYVKDPYDSFHNPMICLWKHWRLNAKENKTKYDSISYH